MGQKRLFTSTLILLYVHIKGPYFLPLCEIHKTVCPGWKSGAEPRPFSLPTAWPSQAHRHVLPRFWMLLTLALTAPLWESSIGHFDIFWAFPCPRVSCLWGCQNSFSCSAHNPPPEGSGFLPGQLQRISQAEAAEVQSHSRGLQKILLFFLFFVSLPFSPLKAQVTLRAMLKWTAGSGLPVAMLFQWCRFQSLYQCPERP